MARWITAVVGVTGALACGVGGPAEPREGVGVFVSVLPYEQIVERVGGGRVQVSVMVGPGRSPATYEPTPRQMAALARASLYVRADVPFEHVWMERIAAEHPRLRVADCGARESAGGAGASLAGEEIDPHAWTSPPRVKRIASCVRDALGREDPAHRAEYEAAYEAFARDLDTLDSEIRALLTRANVRHFLVFHPAWGAFARTYGLEQIAIEPGGREPGARSLARTLDRARRLGIRRVFVQPQFPREPAQRIAEAIGARVLVVDPLAESLLENLRSFAQTLAEAGA